MNIAELFVNLGIKGDDKTKSKVEGVKKEMGNLKGMSLQAKAAILAAFYGLQRLTAGSMNAGAELNRFNNLTGLSTKKLQQWQYANKQAGGTAEEVAGMVQGMQTAFAAMEMGEGPAKYLGLFAEVLGDFDPNKMQDVFYTLEKAREFLKNGGTGNTGQENEILRSMGISDGVIAGLRGGYFDQSTLNRAPIKSDSQNRELTRVKAMWTNLFDFIENQIAALTTKHGGTMVKGITQIVKSLAMLFDNMIKLGEKTKAMELLSKIIENLANLIGIVASEMSQETLMQKEGERLQKKALFEKGINEGGNKINPIFKWLTQGKSYEYEPLIKGAAVPNVGRTPQSINNSPVIFNQTNNGVDLSQAGAFENATKKIVNEAWAQVNQTGG